MGRCPLSSASDTMDESLIASTQLDDVVSGLGSICNP